MQLTVTEEDKPSLNHSWNFSLKMPILFPTALLLGFLFCLLPWGSSSSAEQGGTRPEGQVTECFWPEEEEEWKATFLTWWFPELFQKWQHLKSSLKSFLWRILWLKAPQVSSLFRIEVTTSFSITSAVGWSPVCSAFGVALLVEGKGTWSQGWKSSYWALYQYCWAGGERSCCVFLETFFLGHMGRLRIEGWVRLQWSVHGS